MRANWGLRLFGHLFGRTWTSLWSNVGLGVVDLVDACADLDSLGGETLLALLFACSSVPLTTY